MKDFVGFQSFQWFRIPFAPGDPNEIDRSSAGKQAVTIHGLTLIIQRYLVAFSTDSIIVLMSHHIYIYIYISEQNLTLKAFLVSKIYTMIYA